MAKKKKGAPYMDLYKQWSKRGRLPEPGLCNSIPRSLDAALGTFLPTSEDRITLREEGHSTLFWGSGLRVSHPDLCFKFTPLRKTIMIFLAAINEEI